MRLDCYHENLPPKIEQRKHSLRTLNDMWLLTCISVWKFCATTKVVMKDLVT